MYYTDYLEHYGILGMKWGVRRYQNADGTLTNAGKKRYKGDTPEQIERSERRKAKVVKGFKKAAAIGAIGAAGALAVSSLTRGNIAGAVSVGSSTISRLMTSGMLDKQTAASLIQSNLSREGSKSLSMAAWANAGNPYYKPGMTKSQQELMTAVTQYYLKNKK